MSYVIAAPELMATAATDLAGISSNLDAARSTAALHTTGLVPAAADEVSAAVTQLFSHYGSAFQGLVGQASVFHSQFLHTLTASASAYARTEAANAAQVIPDPGPTPPGPIHPPATAPAFVKALAADLNGLWAALPPNVQNAFGTLASLVVGWLSFGVIIPLVVAGILSSLQGFLGQFGL